MTTAPEHLAQRSIVVVSDCGRIENQPTYKLLTDLGHEVVPATSPDDAMNVLSASVVDLLVVDLPGVDDKRRLFERLDALPATSKPRRVAVFSEEVDDYARTVQRQQGGPRVHVFLKPLHVHGLLNVLRSIEGRGMITQPA
jgi:CheY-like chemotaxis protein